MKAATPVIDHGLLPHLGAERLAALTPAKAGTALDVLAASGSRSGGKLSPRSVQLAATILRGALDWAMRQGYVQRNVAKLAPIPKVVSPQMKVWTAAEARSFASVVRGDRLGA